MAEREQKKKPAPKEREDEVVEEAAPARQGEALKEAHGAWLRFQEIGAQVAVKVARHRQ